MAAGALGDAFPDEPHRASAFPFGVGGEGQQAGLHGIDDLAEADRAGFACQQVAAGLAAAALDQAPAAQVVEDLDQKIRRDRFTLREFLKPCNGSPVMTLGLLGHRAARVIELLRNPHGYRATRE